MAIAGVVDGDGPQQKLLGQRPAPWKWLRHPQWEKWHTSMGRQWRKGLPVEEMLGEGAKYSMEEECERQAGEGRLQRVNEALFKENAFFDSKVSLWAIFYLYEITGFPGDSETFLHKEVIVVFYIADTVLSKTTVSESLYDFLPAEALEVRRFSRVVPESMKCIRTWGMWVRHAGLGLASAPSASDERVGKSMSKSCHCHLMSCFPYFNSRQQKLIKKLWAEKAFREEIQSFRETMRSFREKIKAFREKIRAFRIAIQAFWEEEKAIWEEETAFREDEKVFQEEEKAFWRDYRDFWKEYNAFWKKDEDFWKEDQLLWEKNRVLLDEDITLWAEEIALWADEKALLEEERALWKEEEALREDEQTLQEDEIFIWEGAFGPERERLLLAVAVVAETHSPACCRGKA
nr:PREDICTED: coiled-coil domain-containing protein 70 [Struthio camelus australis]